MRFSTRGVARHDRLGGDDLDELLARAVDRIAAAQEWSLRDDARAWGALLNRCEMVKRQLSTSPAARLSLPDAWPSGGGLDLKIDRAFCDPVFRPVAVDAASRVKELLDRVGWDARSVDRVVLLGGTTHVPVVLEELSVVLERMLVPSPIATVAVARGAALLGARHAAPARLAACH
jgi:molecular chaperone DnaK